MSEKFVRCTTGPKLGFVEADPDMVEQSIVTDREFVKSLPVKNGIKILDVGCALGRDLDYLKKTYPKCELVGVDSLECKNRLPIEGIKFVIADALKLPFPDQYFDIAYSNTLYTELTDKQAEQAKTELARVSKEFYYTEMREDRSFVRFKNANSWV